MDKFTLMPHPFTVRHQCIGDIVVATSDKYVAGNEVIW